MEIKRRDLVKERTLVKYRFNEEKFNVGTISFFLVFLDVDLFFRSDSSQVDEERSFVSRRYFSFIGRIIDVKSDGESSSFSSYRNVVNDFPFFQTKARRDRPD